MSRFQPTNIADMTAVELTHFYKNKQLSPVESVEAFFSRIEKYNPIINAYSVIARESALASAKKSESRWLRGEQLSNIDGVPSSIKDLTMVAGFSNRSGSLTSTSELMKIDAPFAARMKESGAVIMGKTTTPEFGWKGVTDSPLTGITRNPWNTDLTAGGSSGGAAAAAALNMGVLHQGSDAGGSIRIPAGFCGVFGLKPTFGYIPQWPASSMTTLSHIGPITRTIEDSLLLMDIVAKPDKKDWYSTRVFDGSWNESDIQPLKDLRIAYSPTLGYVDVKPGVKTLIDNAVKKLEELGAIVNIVDPGFEDPLEAFSTLWFSGAAKVVSSLSLKEQRLLDPGFLEISLEGNNIPIVEYMKAVDYRANLGQKMQEFHSKYDILITPTLPNVAFKAGQNTESSEQKHWMEWTPFSYPFNMTQQPALSIPCGQLQGLPVGLQIIADRGNDLLAINVAKHIERTFPSDFSSLTNLE